MSKITLRNGSTGHELTHIGPGGLLTEGLDGEQTLKFTVLPDDVGYIDFTTRVEFEGQYYDPVKILKYGNALGAFADVEAEHVSYRLNEYTHGQISLNGTYSQILARCLNGTDLTPGTCISGTLQGGVMENVTAREALMTAAGYMGGELSFNGFTVSIVAHRGNSTRANIMDTGSVVSVEVDKAKGETESSYRIGLGRRGSLAVGDEIRLVYAPFSLDVNTRIIKMKRNPYNNNEASIEVGRHIPEITDSFVQAQVKSAEEIELAKGMATQAQEIAEDVAQDMVDRNTKGYITFQTDANGGTEAIYFSATKPITGAVQYWKWSMNGLAYTSDAGSTWNVGITADGKIMGDRIAAGTISANAIDADSLYINKVYYRDTDTTILKGVQNSDHAEIRFGIESGYSYTDIINFARTHVWYKNNNMTGGQFKIDFDPENGEDPYAQFLGLDVRIREKLYLSLYSYLYSDNEHLYWARWTGSSWQNIQLDS